jgi:hypothetical protein
MIARAAARKAGAAQEAEEEDRRVGRDGARAEDDDDGDAMRGEIRRSDARTLRAGDKATTRRQSVAIARVTIA